MQENNKNKQSYFTRGSIKNIFDINVTDLSKTTDIVASDLTGGTANAVNTINELKQIILELIRKGKES